MESTKKTLFKSALKGDWYGVQKIYQEHHDIHQARITSSGGTALHIAVSRGEERVVEQLVKLIQLPGKGRAVQALEIGDKVGNTPLHLAAPIGNVRMCERIVKIDPKLIGRRNCRGETPFFLAALHGRKDVFLRLHSIISGNGDSQAGYSHCRRGDGETILHCAIKGEYFDLAFQIIRLYGDLVNSVNEDGFSALHFLASKPSAFPSGSRLGQFEKIIYHCIFVDKLQVRKQHHRPPLEEEDLEHGVASEYPENYQPCINFAQLVWKLIGIVVLKLSYFPSLAVGWGLKRTGEHPIAEDFEGQRTPQHFPPNYSTCFESIKPMTKFLAFLMSKFLDLGYYVRKMKEEKEKHVWSVQITDELLVRTSMYEYEDIVMGRIPPRQQEEWGKPYSVTDGCAVTFDLGGPLLPSEDDSLEDNIKGEINKTETPILIAAKHGVAEMVEKIFELFPVAIDDMNSEKKNLVLLAAEHARPRVYQFLLNMKTESIFRIVDKDGNSALHLAARLGEFRHGHIPGPALQMQWEIKWYEFVKNSTPHMFVRFNKQGKTPEEVFTETHKDLVQRGGQWLTNTSQSCSVVAALIATVAFATLSAVPGGVKDNSGTPNLENDHAFNIFAISSLIAVCFSMTAVVMFLAILNSRYQEKDFRTDLPSKLFLGLTSLFVSIASMLISFCAGHALVLKDKLKFAGAFPIYAITCLPTFFALAQFPFYFDLILATFRKVPRSRYKVILR